MKAVGIRRVNYTDDTGNVVTENVRDMVSIQASSVTRFIHHLKTSDDPDKEPGDNHEYFEKLLKDLFPATVKRYNFYNFMKHNFKNVLPDYTYSIESKDGKEVVMIYSPKSELVTSSTLLP